jgi:hypothetical protein
VSLAFRQLRVDARVEAVQEVLATPLVDYVRLVERASAEAAFSSVLAAFAISQVRRGRHAGTRGNSRDLCSPITARRN